MALNYAPHNHHHKLKMIPNIKAAKLMINNSMMTKVASLVILLITFKRAK